VALVNGLLRIGRRKVYQGCDVGEVQEWGVWVSIVEVREERAEENQ